MFNVKSGLAGDQYQDNMQDKQVLERPLAVPRDMCVSHKQSATALYGSLNDNEIGKKLNTSLGYCQITAR